MLPFEPRSQRRGADGCSYRVQLRLSYACLAVLQEIGSDNVGGPARAKDKAENGSCAMTCTDFDAALRETDYACLRFYLQREGWKGTITINESSRALWIFKSSLKHAPERYRQTSVKGLYELGGDQQPPSISRTSWGR
jgi:hypothetical protein